MITRFLLAATILIMLPGLATAQIENLLAPFSPKDCESSARTRANNAGGNAKLIGLINIGLSVPLNDVMIDIGLNSSDGKAKGWYYIFTASPMDTVVFVPMIRLASICQDPTFLGLPPADFDSADFSKSPIPSGYVEGKGLSDALKKSAQFVGFRTMHPDSQPSLSILTSTPEEILGFPINTPFWLLNWGPLGQDPGSNEFFQCIVHAVTGQAFCGDELITGVSEIADANVFVAPNPVRDHANFGVPVSWIGQVVQIEMVDMSGRSVYSHTSQAITVPLISINTSELPTGSYVTRISTRSQGMTVNLRVIK